MKPRKLSMRCFGVDIQQLCGGTIFTSVEINVLECDEYSSNIEVDITHEIVNVDNPRLVLLIMGI